MIRNKRPEFAALLLVAILGGCQTQEISVQSSSVKHDLQSKTSYVDVVLLKADFIRIEESGEALSLMAYHCAERSDKAMSFGLDSRRPIAVSADRVTLRFSIVAVPRLSRDIADVCGFLATEGYSLTSFKSQSFLLGRTFQP